MPSDHGHEPQGGGRRMLFADRDLDRGVYAYGPNEEAYGESDPMGGDDFDEEPERGGLARTLLKAGVALIAVVLLGGVVGYAYYWGTQSGSPGDGDLPVVAADESPERVPPEDPGGMEVPHQDALVLNERGDDGELEVERLLPPPETPEALPEPEIGESDLAERGDGEAVVAEDRAETGVNADERSGDGAEIAELPELETPELPLAPSERTGEPGDDGAAPEPSETSPSGTSQSASQQDQAAAPVDEPETASPSELGESAEAASSEPEEAAGTGAGQEQEQEQESLAALPSAEEGGFAIQLAAVREEARAREAWGELQGAHPNVLSNLTLDLQRAEIEGQGTFWRIRTGPFADRAAAEQACERLEANGQGCLVVSR